MKSIQFTAHYGEIKKKVKLSPPNGGSQGWHVYIDRFYCGVLLKRNGEWFWFHNNPDEFTADDIQVLTGMIEAGEGQ